MAHSLDGLSSESLHFYYYNQSMLLFQSCTTFYIHNTTQNIAIIVWDTYKISI